MLPIYICQWKNDWKIELEDPIDYNKPLSQNEREEMMSFLSQFGMKDSSKDNINTTPSEPANVEEDFTDDDSFFADINDNIMITPSDDENNSKTQEDAKKIAFSIANSPLVKTAFAGEDPNWGRIIMAIGKSNVNINLKKLSINFGKIKIIEKGQLSNSYDENITIDYMKNKKIDVSIDIATGKKNFTAFTMDLTKKYIEINSDYRS